VLFRDPEVGRFYLHDSPYTYFTSTELHLGEISLECSRAGASAAALWLTFRLLAPTPDGLGRVLAAGRRAALKWADLITASDTLELYQRPELDIVSYVPAVEPATLTAVDAASARVLADGMAGTDPVFLSTLKAGREAFTARHPKITADADGARILRSVLMKSESEHHVERVHDRVERLTRSHRQLESPRA
jgi:glutamate/tyrosine decarboxylase-like PLP-dependent enzyme